MDLKDLQEQRTSWFRLPWPVSDVEVLLKYASPEESRRFRDRMVQRGIFKDDDVAQGRWANYVEEFTKFYVLDWRSFDQDRPFKLDGQESPPYSVEWMGRLLNKVRVAFDEVNKELLREQAFFSNGAGGPT